MTARRILVCLHDFMRGGTERIAIKLAGEWAKAGRTVTILYGDPGGGLLDTVSSQVEVVPVMPAVERGFCSRWRLAHEMGKYLGRIKPDAIFLPGNFHALLANDLHAADRRTVIALKISNPPFPEHVPFAATIFRRITRSVNGFAAMNSGLARQLKMIVPDRNIVTLNDPVYVQQDPQDKPHAGITQGKQILWVGRLEAQKDPELAVRVIAQMDPTFHLTMLGEGSMGSRLMKLVCELKVKSKVTLVGYVPEIDPYLCNTDALLITSRYEGGPAVAIEALALGVPVVSTDCSYLLGDILTDPAIGRIVIPREPNAIAKAIVETLATARNPETLKNVAKLFDPQRCAEKYLDWLDGLVRHGS